MMFLRGTSRWVGALSVFAAVAVVPVVAWSAPSEAASTVATKPATLVDTRTGTAAPERRLLGGESLSVLAFGHAGIPGDGASAVRLSVRLDSATGSGTISIHYADARDPHPAVLAYSKGHTTTKSVTVALGQNGRIAVENVSAAHVQLRAQVIGYSPLANADSDAWTSSVGGDAGQTHANPSAAGVSVSSLAHLKATYTTHTTAYDNSQVIAGSTGYTFYSSASSTEPGLFTVRAYNLKTGRTVWTAGALRLPERMAVYGNDLYATNWDDHNPGITVTAFSLTTHKVLWHHQVTSPPSGYTNGDTNGLAVNGGVVLAVTGYVDAYDAATGAHLWVDKTHAPPVTAAEDGHAVLSYVGGDRVVNIRTGKTLWTLSGATSGSVTFAGHRIFFDTPTEVSAYSDMPCGHPSCGPLWTQRTGYSGTPEQQEESRIGLSASSTLVAIMVNAADGSTSPSRFRTFDARTGTVLADRAQFGTAVFAGAQPVIAGQAILVSRGSEIDSVPTSCRGACRWHTVLRYTGATGNTLLTMSLAEHTLIAQSPDDSEPTTAYTIG